MHGTRTQLLHAVKVVRDDHDGEPLALAHLDQQPQQARLRFGVQPRQRFIENQRGERASNPANTTRRIWPPLS